MSFGNQNFGFERPNLAVIGKEILIDFRIPGVQSSGIASAEWVLSLTNPEEESGGSALITKTVGAGIVLVNNNDDVLAQLTVDGDDTTGFSPGIYFHRLDYVDTGGSLHEAARGLGKLTRRL